MNSIRRLSMPVLVFGTLCLWAVPIRAQGTLTVYLMDAETTEPVEEALVGIVPTLKQDKKLGHPPDTGVRVGPLGLGAFRSSPLRAGDYVVQVLAHGYAPELRRVDLIGIGGQREVFQLVPSGRLSGRVVNAEGEGLAGAVLNISPTDSETLAVLEDMSISTQFPGGGTDLSGRYSIASHVPVGTPFVLEVAHPDYMPVLSEELTLGPGEEHVLEIVMSSLGVKLVGRVVNEAGEGLGNAIVSVSPEMSGEVRLGGKQVLRNSGRFSQVAAETMARRRRQLVTGPDGSFAVDRMPAGPVVVRARLAGYRTSSLKLELGQGDNSCRIVLKYEKP